MTEKKQPKQYITNRIEMAIQMLRANNSIIRTQFNGLQYFKFDRTSLVFVVPRLFRSFFHLLLISFFCYFARCRKRFNVISRFLFDLKQYHAIATYYTNTHVYLCTHAHPCKDYHGRRTLSTSNILRYVLSHFMRNEHLFVFVALEFDFNFCLQVFHILLLIIV